jgi:hypothetical protein
MPTLTHSRAPAPDRRRESRRPRVGVLARSTQALGSYLEWRDFNLGQSIDIREVPGGLRGGVIGQDDQRA